MNKKQLKLDKNQVYTILIRTSFNNTRLVLLKDGDVLKQISAGFLKIKGTQESTPYAAERITNMFIQEVYNAGGRSFNVHMSGVGLGRSAAVRSLQEFANTHRDRDGTISFGYVKDITPHRHNTTKHA